MYTEKKVCSFSILHFQKSQGIYWTLVVIRPEFFEGGEELQVDNFYKKLSKKLGGKAWSMVGCQ